MPWMRLPIDALFLLSFLFLNISPALAAPSSALGVSPTPRLATTGLKKTLSRSYVPLSPHTSLLLENKVDKKLIVKDYLASTRVVVDKNGKILSSQGYYPYGSQRSAISNQQVANRMFTGHRTLPNTTVYAAGVRFYSPTTGQFIQPDTVEGPNRYSYGANDPVMFNDPSGRMVRSQDMPGQNSHERRSEAGTVKNKGKRIPHGLENDIDVPIRKIIETHSSRNPFDPVDEQENWVRYLASDLNRSLHYSSRVSLTLDLQDSAKEELKKHPNFTKLNLINLHPANLALDIALASGDLFWKEWDQMTLSEKIDNDMLICQDFSRIFYLIASENGIDTVMIANGALAHMYNGVAVNKNGADSFWIVDSTSGGTMERPSEHNKIGYSINDFAVMDFRISKKMIGEMLPLYSKTTWFPN